MNKLLVGLTLVFTYVLGYDLGKKDEKQKNDEKWQEVRDQIDDIRKEFRESQSHENSGTY